MAIVGFTQRDLMLQQTLHELLSLAKYDSLPDAELFEERAWRNKKIKALQKKCEEIGIKWQDLCREAVVQADEYRG